MGTLYLVGTPIGNLGDLSARQIETLKNVDFIAAEDTRRTMKLLNHLKIKKELIRCDEAEEERAARRMIDHLKKGGSVAFCTDAGTPAISDPGRRLVQLALQAAIP